MQDTNAIAAALKKATEAQRAYWAANVELEAAANITIDDHYVPEKRS